MINRTDKLRAKMKEQGLDAVLVTSELNQRYLSGYPFTDGLLLITERNAYLVTDFRYYEEAQKSAFPEYTVVMPESRRAFLTGVFEEDCARRVGFESETLSCADYEKYKEAYPSVEFVSLGHTIEGIREIKDGEELACMAEAQRISEQALSHLLSMIHPDITEIDVALELEFAMRRLGAESIAFETIAVSGDASALPHGKPRNVKLQKGFLTMDFGAMYKGYLSDMTRTVAIGKADSEMKKLYDTVLSAQLAGLEAVRAGADCAACDAAARDLIDAAGYPGCFGHSLGHGVGLYIHESPRLSKSGLGEKLRAGQVVTVEPGIYIFGKYGCRIEDMVAVTEDGCRNFTHAPKELIELF